MTKTHTYNNYCRLSCKNSYIYCGLSCKNQNSYMYCGLSCKKSKFVHIIIADCPTKTKAHTYIAAADCPAKFIQWLPPVLQLLLVKLCSGVRCTFCILPRKTVSQNRRIPSTSWSLFMGFTSLQMNSYRKKIRGAQVILLFMPISCSIKFCRMA